MKTKLLLSAFSFLAQMAIAQTNNTFPAQGYVGIGTLTPTHALQIAGGHGDTNLSLFYPHPSPAQQANLTLWASEPGLTWTGAGIGNNVSNFVSTIGGTNRISTARGGSYMRLLDGEIRINVVKSDGADINSLAVAPSGNIGIGTTSPTEKLSVNGKIRAKEIKVEATNWPDYVFEKGYKVEKLEELESYIKLNKHLPGIPSAKEVEANGIELGEMNKLLLKKVEELTLHLIEKDKEVQNIGAKQKEMETLLKKLLENK